MARRRKRKQQDSGCGTCISAILFLGVLVAVVTALIEGAKRVAGFIAAHVVYIGIAGAVVILAALSILLLSVRKKHKERLEVEKTKEEGAYWESLWKKYSTLDSGTGSDYVENTTARQSLESEERYRDDKKPEIIKRLGEDSEEIEEVRMAKDELIGRLVDFSPLVPAGTEETIAFIEKEYGIRPTYDKESCLERIDLMDNAFVQNAGLDDYNMFIRMVLKRCDPVCIRTVIIDPGGFNTIEYGRLPHNLMPALVDTDRILDVLSWLNGELDIRKKLFIENRVRTIQDYDQIEQLPRVLVIIPEMNGLQKILKAEPNANDNIISVLLNGEKFGIHFIAFSRFTIGRLYLGKKKGLFTLYIEEDLLAILGDADA